jgi:hypothetical protein
MYVTAFRLSTNFLTVFRPCTLQGHQMRQGALAGSAWDASRHWRWQTRGAPSYRQKQTSRQCRLGEYYISYSDSLQP